MPHEAPNPTPGAYRLLALITTPKLADKAVELLHKRGLPFDYRMHAEGTAPNETLELLGLGGTERTLLVSFMTRHTARETLRRLQSELKLAGSSNGIAFTTGLTGASSLMIRVLTEIDAQTDQTDKKKEVTLMADSSYSLILAIVDQGCSDMVMEAARPAGATGGTVISSRWLPNEETLHFKNISLQQEKDIVVILADDEKKLAIMQAIGDSCGVKSPAHGIVTSVPAEDVIGL